MFERIWISLLQPPPPPLRFTARAADAGSLPRSSRSSWSPGQIWERVDQFTFKENVHIHIDIYTYYIYIYIYNIHIHLYIYIYIYIFHIMSYRIIAYLPAILACNYQILLVIKIRPVLSLCVKALPSIARTVWLLRCHPDKIGSHNNRLFPLGELARALLGWCISNHWGCSGDISVWFENRWKSMHHKLFEADPAHSQ